MNVRNNYEVDYAKDSVVHNFVGLCSLQWVYMSGRGYNYLFLLNVCGKNFK